METARKTALMEQPEIVELFRVLEGNGLTKEQKEVESLVKYLDGMEVQFGQVLEELRDVKEQLSQIQDGGVKRPSCGSRNRHREKCRKWADS